MISTLFTHIYIYINILPAVIGAFLFPVIAENIEVSLGFGKVIEDIILYWWHLI